MGLEFELKYAATPELLDVIQAAYSDEYVTIPMTTSYYDTPDGAVSTRRWTLRHRREGEYHVCTLKTPAGESRNEWETNCDAIEKAIPELVRQSGLEELAQLTETGLVLSCGAEFTRLAAAMTIGQTVVELALDRGVLKNGTRVLPFAEMEVELKSGSEDDARRFAETLAERFSLKPQPKSKFARAKALGQED